MGIKFKASNFKENTLILISKLSAFSVIAIIIGVIISLTIESLPAIKEFGIIDFLFNSTWNYSENQFGIARPLIGSFATSIIAVTIATPIGIGIAIFVTEICPKFLKNIISTAIELLAAIPSIIYGMWGLFYFAPFIEKLIQNSFLSKLALIPYIGSFFKLNYAGGIGLLTSGLVLSIMVIPFIASISREAIYRVPNVLKESAYGIGSEKWEVISKISLPYAKKAIFAGVIIALGRALGETMAIAYIIGNMNIKLTSIFDPYVTVTSILVNEFNEASGIHASSLFYMALILFLLNFSILTIAKLYILRSKA